MYKIFLLLVMVTIRKQKGEYYLIIGKTTLIKDKLSETMGWSYTNASYSLTGIGTNTTTIQGKVYNICLKDTKGVIHKIIGYSVPNILKDDWSFPALTSLTEGFPKVS